MLGPVGAMKKSAQSSIRYLSLLVAQVTVASANPIAAAVSRRGFVGLCGSLWLAATSLAASVVAGRISLGAGAVISTGKGGEVARPSVGDN